MPEELPVERNTALLVPYAPSEPFCSCSGFLTGLCRGLVRTRFTHKSLDLLPVTLSVGPWGKNRETVREEAVWGQSSFNLKETSLKELFACVLLLEFCPDV